ncbi:hypothetical protein [Winogradskyella vincentii]|uniref:Uncharacterized protein n=1 Tax=Winogradskyella vincentii TaxID=2877122 RepID=A0ABS7Y0R1_9FLAO|nr:hypothetical protein [Winogradskyella vincentii]MCA0153513.1 hypothetical protein [Winogradskyella vincentii]
MAKNKNNGKLALAIGLLGTIAGLILIFQDNLMIGIFGTIASLGVSIKGYQDYKSQSSK